MKQMKRRKAIQIGSYALAGSAVYPFLLSGCSTNSALAGSSALFYSDSMQSSVMKNSNSPLLKAVFEIWRQESPEQILIDADKMIASGDVLRDFATTLNTITRASVVQIVEPTVEREAALVAGLEAAIDRPKWDYFLDGGSEDLGIMRSSLATARTIFAREVLGTAVSSDLESSLRTAVAEKGCRPCYNTIRGMDDPSSVEGWSFDEMHGGQYEIDLSRWPEILGANNLRAIPTMGLGLGSIWLAGHDDRANRWLQTAESSAQTFLGFLSPDGSYFEGLSYIDYAFRTLLAFLDAHQRIVGGIDWPRAMNVDGILDFILAMQAGRQADGSPDIVNFSDARRSVYPCIPAWLGMNGGGSRAQYVANNVSDPGYYLDYLWYNPDLPEQTPDDSLKNVQLDLDWIIARSGWQRDDAVVAFRGGGPANHEHADRNSFFFKVYDERLLTDHFGAAYDWRQEGWLLRLTEAHNAVLIDGAGHQYHNGEEGTNESLARATTVVFDDEGDRVSWTSDATQAYNLVNDAVESVLRTIAFAKPQIVIVRDVVRMTTKPSTMSVRYFPDNRDGEAEVSLDEQAFVIRRPKASLHGFVFGDTNDIVYESLELPGELGGFPFVEVSTNDALEHEVLTVLVARRIDDEAVPQVHLVQVDDGWMFEVNNVAGKIDTGGEHPKVTWF